MTIDELIVYLFSPAAQVALIVGIAEIIKKTGIDKKFIPLFDLALGLISGVAVFGVALGYGITKGIMVGFALGLSACGLFSGIKNLFKSEDQHNDDEGH